MKTPSGFSACSERSADPGRARRSRRKNNFRPNFVLRPLHIYATSTKFWKTHRRHAEHAEFGRRGSYRRGTESTENCACGFSYLHFLLRTLRPRRLGGESFEFSTLAHPRRVIRAARSAPQKPAPHRESAARTIRESSPRGYRRRMRSAARRSTEPARRRRSAAT